MSKSFWLGAILLALLLLSACSGSTDDDDVSEVLISEVLNDIVNKFNVRDLDGIMAYYHTDYLHQGDILSNARYTWEIRMAIYTTMEIEDIEVTKEGLEATAGFTMTLTGTEGDEVFTEPTDHGDFSYYIKDVTSWKIYGDQHYGSGIGYQISLETDPEGALIYMDDASVYQTTPVILQAIPGGTHTLRLYKPGYNEWEQQINVPEMYRISHTLEEPGYPVPNFEIVSPRNGINYASTTVSLEGILSNRTQTGGSSSFDGTRYIMTFNGQETILGTNGTLIELLSIRSGHNELQLRATNADGNTGWSDTITFEGMF